MLQPLCLMDSFIFSAEGFAILAAYKARMISNFEPPDPPTGILQRQRTKDNARECGHISYDSPDQFVDHILWFLHPNKSMHLPCERECEHSHYLRLQLLNNMCTHCVNILLCKVHFLDIINLYFVSCREWKFTQKVLHSEYLSQREIVRSLFMHILWHPKMHRVIIGACALDKEDFGLGEKRYVVPQSLRPPGFKYVHDWDYLCELLIMGVSRCDVFDIPTLFPLLNDDLLRRLAKKRFKRQLTFCATFWISFKYWTKYQFLFFVKHYLCRMETAFVEICEGRAFESQYGPAFLAKSSISKVDVDNPYYVTLMMIGFLELVCKKAKRMGLNRTEDRKIGETIRRFSHRDIGDALKLLGSPVSTGIFEFYQQCRKAQQTFLLENAVCGWSKCSKKGFQIVGNMKVCKQCMMEYYCCRRCQKKAWNREHRTRCKRLQTFYSLD